MKTIFTTLFVVCFICGCKSKNEKQKANLGQDTFEILFEVKTVDKEDLEIFEDGIIPWISISDPGPELANLIGKDDYVISHSDLTLVIDYPLNAPVEINIVSDDSKGFTRRALIEKISAEYQRIYNEEEETAKIKTTPVNEREGLINRNQTDGKYGIWGHDLSDLDLTAIIVTETASGEIRLELVVES